MADTKTALAGLDWLSALGVPAAHINNARTALQSKAAPQTKAGPIPASIAAQPQGGKQAAPPALTRDDPWPNRPEVAVQIDRLTRDAMAFKLPYCCTCVTVSF